MSKYKGYRIYKPKEIDLLIEAIDYFCTESFILTEDLIILHNLKLKLKKNRGENYGKGRIQNTHRG